MAQTTAGCTGTGTHGSGTPLLSTLIEEMRLVDSTGRLRKLSPSQEPELFSAARVHLGCLGVVIEITFKCTDGFDLEERREIVPFDRALADLEGYLAENDYVKLWWLPYTDVIQVYLFNRTDAKRTMPRAYKQRWMYWLFEAKKRFGLCVLNFTVTSNHVHLLFYNIGNGNETIPKCFQGLSI